MQSLMTQHVKESAKYPSNSIKKKELDRACALLIAKDMRPTSIVEGEGMKKFVELLDPRYQMPCRRTLRKNLIPTLKEEEKAKVMEEICTTNWVAITTDLWSSLTCTSFMAITAHYISGEEGTELHTKVLDCSCFHLRHTAENIKDRLLSVISDFNAAEKIVCVVSDNGANVKKAILDSGLTGLACYAHTLNLCVTGTLKQMVEFEALRKKISDLVTFLHRSNNGKEDFDGVQFRLKVPVIKSLVADVKTRWNSVFFSFSKLRSQEKTSLSHSKNGSLLSTTNSFSNQLLKRQWKCLARNM
jgi:hypothetical protein